MTDADRAALEADLKQAEGLRLKAYQDSVGVWTCGYGTNLQELTITEAQADEWLQQMIQQCETEAARIVWYPLLSGARQRAITELLYNLGMTRLLLFRRFLASMAEGRYDDAAAHLLDSLWARQVGPKRANRIANLIRQG